MFKIINVDCYDRESCNHPDQDPGLPRMSNPNHAKAVVDILNEHEPTTSQRYWKMVEAEYKLRTYAPDE